MLHKILGIQDPTYVTDVALAVGRADSGYEYKFAHYKLQENMRGQRGTLRALAVICHSH